MASFVANIIGVMVAIILLFVAVIPVTSDSVTEANLSGAASTLANQMTLFLVIVGVVLVLSLVAVRM